MMKIPSLPNFGVGKYNLVCYSIWIWSVDQVSKLTHGGSLVVAAPPIVPLYSAADLSVNQPGYWYVAFVPTRLIALIHWVFCVHCIVDSVLGEEISLANNIGRMFGLVCLGSYLARFLHRLAIFLKSNKVVVMSQFLRQQKQQKAHSLVV